MVLSSTSGRRVAGMSKTEIGSAAAGWRISAHDAVGLCTACFPLLQLQDCALHAEALDAMLDSPLGRRVAGTSEADLASLLLNDAYKLKMHRLYAMSYGGVVADFVLNVRRTPFPLKRIRTEARCAPAPGLGLESPGTCRFWQTQEICMLRPR